MTWKTDGRRGFANIAGERRKGFAMMRDLARRLVAFHVSPTWGFGPTEEFMITKDEFETGELAPNEKK